MIVVSSQSRKKLRQALLKHRQGFALSEADYVKQVLKVALNTYKKCIAAPDGTELTLKRHTLINMLKIAKNRSRQRRHRCRRARHCRAIRQLRSQ